MPGKDPFDFGAAATDTGMDLSLFTPKAKPTDAATAQVAADVAQSAGFSRRTPPAPRPERRTRGKTAAPVKGAKRRVNIQEILGSEDRYPDSERAQINMLVPVPVVVRWRDLCKSEGGPAWAVFEKAVEALEAQAKAADGRS